ncbi:MAG: excinuclease ABC subunit UvrC [Deltaproteobacteria bacterium]|nr:excinuclease ABC subunit UvrC [Deltaproteobacteria bacterium]
MMDEQTATVTGLAPDTLRRTLPDAPGVYLFKDRAGEVIYVGKAKNLRKRALSYFRPPSELPHKTALMMSRAAALETILTNTENEAFLLEGTLIKKWLPRYNIILRDDKRFLSLRLDPGEAYPRLTLVRRVQKDGARYFGPFSSAQSVRNTLRLIDRVFPLRKCKGRDLPRRSRPCLNYQLGRCLGPCTVPVPEQTYRDSVARVILFLEGRNRELVRQLKGKMERASGDLNFEDAARIRDQITAVERAIQRQHVVSTRLTDEDVIGLAQKESTFQISILFIRKGSLSDSRDYRLENRGGSRSEVMEAFLKQYYHRSPFIPRHILVSEPVEDMPAIAAWLSELAGRKVLIENPRRGEKRRLLQMAASNAENLLSRPGVPSGENLLEMVRSLLRLRALPRRVEGIDISNVYGKGAVGAVVEFVDGLPHQAGYRSYRVKDVAGIDDYAMMAEIVSRRLRQGDPPDLLVVDGGKGHLRAVKGVVDRSGLAGRIDVASIAKGEEKGGGDKVFVPGRKNPLAVGPDHPVLLLLMRIRDEAHRRAVSHHRKVQRRSLKGSDLDRIPGVGPGRRKTLLRHFGDVDTIARAKPAELEALQGIGPALAKQIADHFRCRGELWVDRAKRPMLRSSTTQQKPE